MLKGCQREMVVVKGDSDSVFESAYFLLKKSQTNKESKNSDIIACANSIIKENSFKSNKKRRLGRVILCIAFFILGALSSVPVFLIIR